HSEAVGSLLDHVDLDDLQRRFRVMEEESGALLPEGTETVYERSLDLRHSGQDAPLEIAAERIFEGDPRERWAARFFALYEAHYGRVDDDNPVEVASIRVRVARSARPPAIGARTSGSPTRYWVTCAPSSWPTTSVHAPCRICSTNSI